MRTTKEALAIVGTCAAIGGGVGVAEESHGRAKADANVVVGEACRDTYANDDTTIGKQVLDCMREGWIPHAGRADDGDSDSNSPAEMQADYPDGVLEGYIKGQQARADRVELFKISWKAVSGAFIGLIITGGFGATGGRNGEEVSRDDIDEPEATAPPHPEPPASDR